MNHSFLKKIGVFCLSLGCIMSPVFSSISFAATSVITPEVQQSLDTFFVAFEKKLRTYTPTHAITVAKNVENKINTLVNTKFADNSEIQEIAVVLITGVRGIREKITAEQSSNLSTISKNNSLPSGAIVSSVKSSENSYLYPSGNSFLNPSRNISSSSSSSTSLGISPIAQGSSLSESGIGCALNAKPYLDLGLVFTITHMNGASGYKTPYEAVSPWNIILASGDSAAAAFDITGRTEYENHDNVVYYNNPSTIFNCTNGTLTTVNTPPNYGQIEVDILSSAKVTGSNTVYKTPNQWAYANMYPAGSTSPGYVSVPVKYTTLTAPSISLRSYDASSNTITIAIRNYAEYMKKGTIMLYNEGKVAWCFGFVNGGLHCGVAISGGSDGIFKLNLGSLSDTSYVLANGVVKPGTTLIIDGYGNSPDGSGGFTEMKSSNTINITSSTAPTFSLIRNNTADGQNVEWTSTNAKNISLSCVSGSKTIATTVELNRTKTFTSWQSLHDAGWGAGYYTCIWTISGDTSITKTESFTLQ